MKTLKQLAAEFNLFTLEDIPEKWNGKYCRKDGGREIPEFLKTLQGYEVGNFFECKIQDKGTPKELYHIEYHTHILIKKNGSDLIMMLQDHYNKKKYTFSPYYAYIYKYHNISHYKKQDALKALKEPNQIGVFTVNKIEAWAKYCEDYIKIMDNLYEQVGDKNAQIKKDIQNTIDALPTAKVIQHDNRTYIDTDLFEIVLDHITAENYLSTKIRFKGGLKDVIELTSLKALV